MQELSNYANAAGIVFILCPALALLPLSLWMKGRRSLGVFRARFVWGVGCYLLAIGACVGMFLWLQGVARGGHGNVSGVHMMLVVPLAWVASLLGAVLSFTAIQSSRRAP